MDTVLTGWWGEEETARLMGRFERGGFYFWGARLRISG